MNNNQHRRPSPTSLGLEGRAGGIALSIYVMLMWPFSLREYCGPIVVTEEEGKGQTRGAPPSDTCL
jgi:hypothetical protein